MARCGAIGRLARAPEMPLALSTELPTLSSAVDENSAMRTRCFGMKYGDMAMKGGLGQRPPQRE